MPSTLSSRSASKSSPPETPHPEALNPEQRAAVEGAGGPLFILAGAGTGKTRVIAHRVAHLLKVHPDWTPAHVLALTFSRKAAEEMRERVEELCGPSADEIAFFTFHAFCHRFLQEHAVTLGLPARPRLLDPAEAWVFFRKLLPELKLNYHWNVADPAGCIEGFLRFISRAKDEMVSPEEYLQHARALPDPQERMRAEEVARVYRIYQRRMQEAGHLDFGDLIGQTLLALRGRPALLKGVRERYRAVLVDEFQDTNVAQIELLKMLAGPEGNLCVVGDDDQAIYRFRGASFASFLLMKEAFPGVQTLRLTRNYRSTPQILGAGERLIRHNEPDRYDPDKRLWTETPAGPPVEVLVCRTEEEKAQLAIAKIRQLLEEMPPPERRLDRIAVLYRAHAHRERLVELLRAQGIPFSVRGGGSLFLQPEIRDLVSFLQAVQDPADPVAFFRLLSHPLWGVDPEILMTASRRAREKEISLVRHLESEAGPEIPEPLQEAASRLLRELKRFRREALRAGVEDWVPRVAEQSFLRAVFRLPPGTGEDPMIGLGRFLRLTYRYAQNYPEEKGLASFLWYLDGVSRAPGGEGPEEEEEVPGERLRLMTVHQAKGLEFDWVILLDLTQGRFPARGRPEPIPFPVELMKEPLPQGDYHLQEERRLCYVACTRARRGLVLMSQDRLRFRPSVFLREMTEGAGPSEIVWREPEGAVAAEEAPAEGGSPSARSPRAAERRLLELADQVRLLDGKDSGGFGRAMEEVSGMFRSLHGAGPAQQSRPAQAALPIGDRFSYTQLETYRTCPQKYLYAYLYRIPIRSTPQMSFGTDLHDCLEWFYREVMGGRVPSLEEMKEGFRRLHAPGRYGEPAQDKEYRRLGEEILSGFYRKQEGRFAPPLFVEKPFLLRLGDATLYGVIDRGDPLEDGSVEIIDYKSGKPKDAAGADEQLQLRLYALAAREVLHLEPKRVSFYYLRNHQVLSFEQKESHFDEARQRALGLIGEIRTGRFEADPSEFKCRWCDFRNLCPASLA